MTWAVGTTGYSRLAKDYSAFTVNFSRGVIAFPLFLITALVTALVTQGGFSGAFGALELRHLGWFTVSMLASYAVGDSLFLISSRSIGIPAALTISSTYPLLTATWGAFAQGEWLTISQSVGLIATVGGVALVILSAPGPQSNPNKAGSAMATAQKPGFSPSTGIFLAFCSAFCWGVNSFCVTRGGQGVPAAQANTLRMAIGILLCAAMGKVFAPRESLRLPPKEYRKWLWVFVVEGYAGSFLFMYGLSHSPLAIGSALASVAPVISVPVALALRLESFSWKRTVGVFIVVSGLFLLVGGLN